MNGKEGCPPLNKGLKTERGMRLLKGNHIGCSFLPGWGQTGRDMRAKKQVVLYVCVVPRDAVWSTAFIMILILQLQTRAHVEKELVQGTQLVHSRSGAGTQVVGLHILCSFHKKIQHRCREL